MHNTPIIIQRQPSPHKEKVEEEQEEEEDIYSPGSVSLPNLSPISSATSSPARGLSPSPSTSSWTPADEDTLLDMTEGHEDESWDKLEDVATPTSQPTQLTYKVHIQVEGKDLTQSPKVSRVKGQQANSCKGQPEAPSGREERAELARHPVRIVPISLQREQVCKSTPGSHTGTRESKAVKVDLCNPFQPKEAFEDKRKCESSDDVSPASIPPPHHKRTASLGGGVRAVPINIQPGKVATAGTYKVEDMSNKTNELEEISLSQQVAEERARVSLPQQNPNAERTPRRGTCDRKISVPVRIRSEEREMGSLLVHQSSEECLWGVKVPEPVAATMPGRHMDADYTEHHAANQSPLSSSSKKNDELTKEPVLPFGPASRPPSHAKPLTIDPFGHTHLPFTLPPPPHTSAPTSPWHPATSAPTSPTRSVPIQREMPGPRGRRWSGREEEQRSSFAGQEELVRVHDGLEVGPRPYP